MVTPLHPEMLVAIFPADMKGIPQEVTPEYVAQQPLVMEHTGGAVHALVMRWLSERAPMPRPLMYLGTMEALKSAVASNLGMSIVPEMAVAKPVPEIVVRPLRPLLSRTLALIEHRNKPNEPALEIVRTALLGLAGQRRHREWARAKAEQARLFTRLSRRFAPAAGQLTAS